MTLMGWPPGAPFPESQRESLGQGGGADFPESSGDRERGKFRPSIRPRLTTLGVVGDDGKPLTKSLHDMLLEVLWQQQETARWLEIISDGITINRVARSAAITVPVRPFTAGPFLIPGIVTGSAYAGTAAAGEQFGQLLPIPLPATKGTITSVTFYDKDDEGIAKDLLFFSSQVTLAADNAAFSISNADSQYVIPGGYVSIAAADFFDMGATRIAVVRGVNLDFNLSVPILYLAFSTPGVDNIAAGAIPMIALTGIY